ncbi:teichoic acids export ABC transporter ATP-binding subunit TagH [Bacillus sp. DX1.1]|uniref:teichoic acids export ABC transporter ATP-binding subunit TagH n=1 Tax=unclassified Bacillus (in: firmicutes) TaxID=185979 RepID=UPI002571115F|nr:MULTISPECIES: teichoic acids export ABC transporter ATP-binding subunit TagH [unclassified Bacillus (in: firmicutes)]MDM5157384.1 teichoic acids export ABC transporter ATP-binding subunit TagH [Bacillus sp. DX1.1]WJE81609.1 teichoic acids export ABC transporter ATP-binding subunit TagH [Bacillus sp. DX3.1]
MNYTVKFQNVTKKYKMYNKPSDKLKDLFRKQEDGEFHYALSDVSFEVPKGEIVGIIGLNGSGKSTLSNLIAGVTIPNKGKIDIKGSAALIAISSGLNGQLTGIENINLKGLMMGLTKEKIKEITPKVIEFADIGKFINQPVKTYSSGMKARLGFAISVNIDPDVLVIDEALSVGDQTFTNKCLKKMNEFKERGKTIFFISHSLEQVKSFCTKAIWLYYGQVREYGDVNEVATNYHSFLKQYNKMTPEERKKLQEEQLETFQHGLLQEYSTEVKAGRRKFKAHRRKFKTHRRKFKKKKGVIMGICLALMAGIITTGFYYKDLLPLKKDKQHTEKSAQSKSAAEGKQAKDEKYIVNSNDISVRKEASTSSERLAVTNFGDLFTISDRKKDTATGAEWLQVALPSGETGWVNAQYIVPFTPSNSVMEDTKLDDVTSLLSRAYGAQVMNAPTYFGKTLNELKTTYPNTLIPSQNVAGRTVVKDGNIQFGISQDKVVEVVFQDISLSITKLQELLGKESISNDSEKNYFYETKNYYIAARSEQTHSEVQSLSIVKK